LSALSFDDTTGLLSATITGAANQSANLDGRYTLLEHSHAISDVVGLQTDLNGKEPTFSKNTAFNKDFGSAAGDVCQGNDSRLSDARTPTAHNHSASDITSGTFADGRIAASNVTQHQTSLTITESQISDLGSYETTLNADQKRKITYGTAAPSGGVDGDIYLQHD